MSEEIILNFLTNSNPFILYSSIFLMAYIESFPVITSFFPGMMVALMIGQFTETGGISIYWAINMIAVGSFLGDITSYYAGPYLMRIPWFKRMMEKDSSQKYWKWFDNNIEGVIILGKVLPFIRSAPSLFAKTRNVSTGKYFLCAIIGSYAWSIPAIYAGNYLGKVFSFAALPIIAGVFTLITIVSVLRKKRRNVN